jgi:DNA invertase Pin-like site-specific DNA recombinase
MRDRLMALGWSEIEVIDNDLGRSAAGGVQRAGFERMVADLSSRTIRKAQSLLDGAVRSHFHA